MARHRQTPAERAERAGAVLGRLSHLALLTSKDPLDRDLQRKLVTCALLSFGNLRKGSATSQDAGQLLYATNISVVCAEAGLGREFLPLLLAGQAAMGAVVQREQRHPGRFVGTGSELQAISAFLEVHEAQLESDGCTEGFITRCREELERRAAAGLIRQVIVNA